MAFSRPARRPSTARRAARRGAPRSTRASLGTFVVDPFLELFAGLGAQLTPLGSLRGAQHAFDLRIERIRLGLGVAHDVALLLAGGGFLQLMLSAHQFGFPILEDGT